VRALADPRTYPHGPARVEHVQTHISHVFLAGPYVYKLKKALRLPFVDQSTPALRHALCLDEVRLNRRLAPPVYLDVLPLTTGADGRPRLGGDGEALDHVVWMRRLPADAVLARRIAEGRVDAGMMSMLARTLSVFHAAAPRGADVSMHATPEALRATWDATLALAAPFAGSLLSPAAHRVLADFGAGFLGTHDTLLRARERAGHAREGHGDLHAAHVYFLDAPVPALPPHEPLPAGVYVIDCLEFSRPLRCIDVAAELAFTTLDLERLGRRDLGDALVAAYVRESGDEMLPTVLPYYVAHRACVRGAVAGLESRQEEVPPAEREAAAVRARAEFCLALRHAWDTAAPIAIACCGRSGTGKTMLATALADATGFERIGSDRLRKERAGLDPDRPAPDPAALYGAAARAANYVALAAEAERRLAAGHGVLVDATFLRRRDRDRLARAARARGCRHVFLECRADPEVVRARLETRAPGTSDAGWATYRAQASEAEAVADDEPHLAVDTGGPLATALDAALEALWRWQRSHPLPEASHP